MTYVDLSFLPAAQALLACLCDAVSDLSQPPQHCSLRYGSQVAFDLSQNEDLCCEGLAWVRMGQATPGWQGELGVVRCNVSVWSLDLEMGIARCAPMGDDQHIVTDLEHTAAAGLLAEDFMALRRAVCCFDAITVPASWDFTVSSWVPSGPEGGCMGSTLSLSVMIIGNDVFPA